jgi:hypothetical protein
LSLKYLNGISLLAAWLKEANNFIQTTSLEKSAVNKAMIKHRFEPSDEVQFDMTM